MAILPSCRAASLTAILIALALLAAALLPNPLLGASGTTGSRGTTSPPSTTTRPPATATTSPARLGLASYNMNNGITDEKSFAIYLDTIRKANPDILAVQEGNPQLFAFLKKQFAKDFPHMQFYPAEASGSFAWLSKLPLAKTTLLPRSTGYFGTPIAEVTFAGKPIQLVNIHLQPTVLQDTITLVQALAAFTKADVIRDQEIRSIFPKLAQDKPIVLLGDFNSLPTFKAPTFLINKGLADSFAAVNKDADSPSWHWKTANGTEWKFRVDYIFTSPQFKTLTSKIIESEASDHFLVVSELELQDTPATAPAASSTHPATTSKPAPAPR